MRRLLIKRMIVVLSIFTLLYTCRYDEMTHMSDYELEWVTNRHEGEIMYLKSQDGVVDTVTILTICWILSTGGTSIQAVESI